MSEIGFKLVSDSSEFLGAYVQAGKAVQDLSSKTESFNADSKGAFKGVTSELEKYTKEIEDSTKTTGKMIDETNKMGKTQNVVKQMKQQIKEFTAEAYKAGAGTKAFTENLAKAGALKDQLADLNAQVNSLNGNLGENLARSAGSSLGLVAKGFEGITALQVVAGENTKQFEETLLQLQSLNSLASVAQEFAGIGDKIEEIKLGFQPVVGLFKNGADSIVSSYTSTNETLRDFFKNFSSNAKGAFTGAVGFVKNFGSQAGSVAKNIGTGFVSFFTNFGTNMKSFAASAKAGINTIGTAIKANPLGILLIAITAIITAFVLLKDKVKPIADLFEFLGEEIDKLTEGFKKALEQLNLIADAAERRAEATIKSTQDEVTAIEKRYDRELRLIRAAGKDSTDKEIEKAQALKKRVVESIAQLQYLFRVNGKLTEDQAKQYKELIDQLKDLSADEAETRLKHQKEITDKEKEEQHKRHEAAKQAAEKRKQLEEQFNSALIELFKKAQAAELEGLDGKAKIEKQKQVADAELLNFRAALEKKGKELNKNFKFTAAQEEQFGKIQAEINRKYNNDILQDDIKLATERANAKLKDVQDSKAAIDAKLKTFELEQQLKEAEINLLKKPAGLSETDFEAQKQKALLDIKKKAAADGLAIRTAEIQAETDLLVQQTQTEIDILNAKGDEKSRAEASRLAGTIEGIKQNGDLQKQILKATTENLINELDKQITDIDQKFNQRGHIIDFQKLLGLNDQDFAKVKAGFSQMKQELQNAVGAVVAYQNQILDSELEANQKRIDSSTELIEQRQSELDTLVTQLGNEQDLRAQGLANNTDAVQQEINVRRAQLEAERVEKEKALQEEKRIQEEKKKLAKAQLVVDSIIQGQNLITASTDIYKSLAPLGPIGIGIASATIGLMFGSFLLAKAKAFQATKQEPGFAEGGYTGDGGKFTEAGVVHKGEYVMNKEKTSKNWDLLHGLHTNDKRLIEIGVQDLLRNTGIVLTPDLPKQLNGYKSDLKAAEMRAVFNTDNSGVEKRIENVEQRIIELLKATGDSITVLPNGDRIEKKGSTTRYIRINK